MKGQTRCRMHGGSSPQAREAGKIRAAKMAAHDEARRMVARAGTDADPIEHLLESLHRSAALVEVWGRMVADLDNRGEVEAGDIPGRIRGWTEWSDEDADYDPLLVRNSKGRWRLHPFVEEYQEALDRRAKFAKLALDAGVAERRVQIAEDQAELVADAVRAAVDGMDVDDQAKQDAVKRAAGRLRVLDGGG